MNTERFVKALSIGISIIVALTSLSVLAGNAGSSSGSMLIQNATENTDVGQNSLSSAGQLSVPDAPAMDSLKKITVPSKYVYLPNIGAAQTAGNNVSRLYDAAPAPMGLADYGFMEPNLNIPYVYETPGFMGSAMFETLDTFYPLSDNPESVSIQLSAVMSGVTVTGNSGYDFWVKNVALFTPQTGEVTLVANIWNLSSESLEFPAGTIASGNGTVSDGLFYYSVGPTIILGGETSLFLYVTSGVYDGNDAVYFSYSTGTGDLGNASSPVVFDTVVFNSGNSVSKSADFRVDGFQKTASGLLYDAELVIGGPGGGSTTTVYSANGQLQLMFMGPTGIYTRLPAAYNYGSNTGETVQGLSSWWSSLMKPRIHLSSGPSILVSMWGSQVSHSGAVNIKGTISPSNAFVFVSMGTSFDNRTAAWAPIGENGSFKFSLPGRISYSGMILMSNHAPEYFTIIAEGSADGEEDSGGCGGGGGGGGGHGGGEGNETSSYVNATLSFNSTFGIYTPLYASGDNQLAQLSELQNGANLSVQGNGSMEDPYVVAGTVASSINPLFSRLNSFGFPAFSGIFVRNTVSYAKFIDIPAFSVNLTKYCSIQVSTLGIPENNNLNSVFYHTSGITVTGFTDISGWATPFMKSYGPADLEFIDSHIFLISSNVFHSMGTSLLIYNPDNESGNGVIWGNYFHDAARQKGDRLENTLSGLNPSALQMFSSGNLIYNNFFDSVKSAYSPGHDMFDSGSLAAFSNDWNLTSVQPLNYSNSVNGAVLTGSIVDVDYQGGNYWTHFDGNIPYNCSGAIANGGDYHPLITPLHNVTFSINGYGKGLHWGVTFDGNYAGGQNTSITLQARDGTHFYNFTRDSRYTSSYLSGYIIISGSDVNVNVSFVPVTYSISFVQTGLVGGLNWTVSMSGSSITSSEDNITFGLTNGTYDYSVSGPDHFNISPSGGEVTVDGSDLSYAVTFSYTLHRATFKVNGLPDGTQWSVDIGGFHASSSVNSVYLMLENGVYNYNINVPVQYGSEKSSGTVEILDGDIYTEVTFTLNIYNVTFKISGLPSGTGWGIAFNGSIANSSDTSITFRVPYGNYTYTISEVRGFHSSSGAGYVNVTDGDHIVSIQFSRDAGYVWAGILLVIGVYGSALAVSVMLYYLLRRGEK